MSMIRWQNYRKKRQSDKKDEKTTTDRSLSSVQHLDLLVLNLTVHSRKYVSNLDEAIASVNYQVEKHFQPQWGVGGTLINKTAAFNLHLNLRGKAGIIGPNSVEFGAQIVDWIVNNEEGIDWSKTGIVYITDPQTGFGGVHVDEKVQKFDIPYALVGVGDSNWSIVLSHETLELLADPWGSRFVQYPSNHQFTYVDQASRTTKSTVVANQDWIVEVCDPVEADGDSYQIGGIPVSNFIGQAYYDPSVTSHIDYRGQLTRKTDDPTWPFLFAKVVIYHFGMLKIRMIYIKSLGLMEINQFTQS